MTCEVNFDGIVGPTHNYAGLSFGNLASGRNQLQGSSPKRAALQGLQKMKFVHDLGIRQAVLPPLRRPDTTLLKNVGFTGGPGQIIEKAWAVNPSWVAACYSASNMWTANAATVSPSIDSIDGRVHLTPANLESGLHRSIEAAATTRVLRFIFAAEHFVVHDPLPANSALADEGAANHTRLSASYAQPGIQTFVYGRSAFDRSATSPVKFPARQTLEASQAVARLHQLAANRCLFVQQSPVAIDAGVFHNDVISVGNENMLMLHQYSFLEPDHYLKKLAKAAEQNEWKLYSICFLDHDLPLADAVRSYLFNSQLLSRPQGGMTLLCPADARENKAAFECIRRLLSEENPVDQVEFLDLRQSMNNGGGPACLRLRVVLTEDELSSVHPGVLFSDALYDNLVDWVKRHYRDELKPDDLLDPNLPDEVDDAFKQLCSVLKLPNELFGF